MSDVVEPDAHRGAPGWVALLETAMRRNRKAESRYAQLATVGLDGAPRCRTVVVRGLFEGPPAALRFVSDVRAQKAAELNAEPRAALCWYFAATREQFRCCGPVTMLGGLEREAAFQALSPRARAGFFWPPPGSPRRDEDVFPAEAPPEPIPASFGAYQMRVEAVDYLALRPTPHERRYFAGPEDAEGHWLRP